MFNAVYRKIHFKLTGKTPALLDALVHLVPIDILEAEISKLEDWRTIVEKLAQTLGVSEDALLFQIADYLNVPVIQKVPPCNVSALPNNLTITDFDRAAVIPAMRAGKIIGLICIDPKRLSSLGLNLKRLEVYLASWSAISKSLKESELIYDQLKKNDQGEQDLLKESDGQIAQKIICRLVKEVLSYGQKESRLTFGAESIEYDFVLSDGRFGKGSISSKLTPLLLRYLRELCNNPKKINFNTAGVGPLCLKAKFLPGPLTTVGISWKEAEAQIQKIADQDQPENFKGTIFLVEDNQTFAEVVGQFLEKKGFAVKLFDNAKDVLELLKGTNLYPAAVVSDLHMPGMDGIALLKELRASNDLGKIPFIALTSDVDVETELSALALGVDAFVTKDEDPRILLLYIERLSGLSSASKVSEASR